MKSVPLNKEASIPTLGLGTWQLTWEECTRGVQYALELGYCHIDTADGYGNHKEVAAGIKGSGVKREDFFITTKLRYRDGYAKEVVLPSIERFLSELEVPYI